MRIGLITHQFFPAFYTGVERLTLNVASQLQRMGHTPVVITSAEHAHGREGEDSYLGVLVVGVAAGAVDLAAPWRQDPRVADRLRELFEREQLDVVHVMHPMRLPQAFSAAESAGLPVVATVADFGYACPRITMLRVDGSSCFDPQYGEACVAACEVAEGHERFEWGRSLLARAAAVVCPCRFTIALHEGAGFDTAHWHHIPWGVDYALYGEPLPLPEHNDLSIGFLGTLLPHKGPHLVVEAIRSLPGHPVRATLYGGSFHEGSYETALRREAGGDERIAFAGGYGHDALADVLRDLDAVVIPSVWHENLPTTGLNALAAGVPVIVSDVGGLTELVDDYAGGVTFKTRNAASLAEVLARLAADRDELARIRAAIKPPASLEEEAWRLEEIYLRSRAPNAAAVSAT